MNAHSLPFVAESDSTKIVEAEETITRLADAMMQQSCDAAAEITALKARLDDALQLGNEAAAILDLRTMEREAARKQTAALLAVIGQVQLWLAEDGYTADERSRAALRTAFLDGLGT